MRWALDQAFGVSGLDRVVVVAPPTHLDEAARWVTPDEAGRVSVVAGGAERSLSVAAGLAALADSPAELVLVHDTARCLVPAAVFDRVVTALAGGDPAVIPGDPVVDTIKRVDASGYVIETPPRVELRAVGTPQGFARDVLERAHAEGGDATDDAALVERLGVRVRVVAGHPLGFKITGPDDLRRAERAVADAQTPPPDRPEAATPAARRCEGAGAAPGAPR